MTYTALHDLASRCLSVSTAAISPFHSIHSVTLNSTHFLKCAIPAPRPRRCTFCSMQSSSFLPGCPHSPFTLQVNSLPGKVFIYPPGEVMNSHHSHLAACSAFATVHITVHRTLAIFSDQLQTQRGDQGHAELTH